MAAGKPPLRHSWISSDRLVARVIARPLREFLNTELAGGILLIAATVVALLWANSPFSASYESLWKTEVSLRLGAFEFSQSLRHWINDGLMTIFFFVIGLEIKREFVAGELTTAHKASLPAIAAVGGMVVPALIYAAINQGGAGAGGWGIPMATDIAFAVGLLAFMRGRNPDSLRVFILSLAIVDDIGAILVIALFYSGGIHLWWLLGAVALIAGVTEMRRRRVWWTPIYLVVGLGAWFATFQSGIHATIAGVALGLLAPARPADPEGAGDAINEARSLQSAPDPASIRRITIQAKEVVSVAERLEHRLHPWTSYLIIPVFALANAGIRISPELVRSAISSSITWGIIAGLVVGKLLGISLFSWGATKVGFSQLPEGMTFRHLLGGAATAGIGFTVSLFIARLAFKEQALVDEATFGILLASGLAAALGLAVLAFDRSSKN